ncbi:protein mono-ADP-ribosyltransferase PARP14-like [Salminus brasiliensis]|uniref:protein mono-ADP-ribosyltransferase PARP14-like n=1 Tax=Salminus brasiliensis TaxID=930266 RepID=UPI003B8397E6
MSNYQYVVFFEASNLSEEDIRKIRQYFQIRRRSGGGECGEVEKLRENIYKLAFKDKADQEQVLSKTDHTVQLSSQRNLQISLSCNDIQEDHSLSQSSSNKQTASNCKPLEKIFKLDPYLLRFLKESKKARADLEERLSSLSSSFMLYPDSEKVEVIRDEMKPEDNIALQKWEANVEDVFVMLQYQYSIHFEVDPEKLRILKQNPFLPSEHLGIYREGNLAVIVGENVEIEKFLDALKLQQQACKECPVSKTNYALVKEQFEQEMKSTFSGTKITQERPDSLVLKGPEEQVQAAGLRLQELVNQIQEKKIQLHHALKTFLSSSGAMQKFQMRFQQSLRCPVLFETRGSDLVLLSLSTGALQEAATAVQRDLCMESVSLEEADSKGIDFLKESLSQALQQANHGSTNVQLIYERETNVDPRIKVQVVGYSTEVRRLKKIIQDYKEDYVTYSDSLLLPLPEMVNNFSELLSLLAVKPVNVSLKATNLPSPCVKLSGPRCKVKDLKKTLDSAIGCLIWEKIKVEGPGVLQFFQGDGLKTQALLQSSLMVLIVLISNAQSRAAPTRTAAWTSLPHLQAAVSSPQGTPADSFVALEIVFGGLEVQQADVLVAPMLNTNLKSTKVGICLLDKAGQQLKSNFETAKNKRRLTPGDVLEVDGTPLGVKKVFFIECLSWSGSTDNSEKAIRYGLERVLALCEQQGWGFVAMPVIGPGPVLSVPIKEAAKILTEVIGTFGHTGFTGSVSTIRIAIMPSYSNSEEIFQAVNTGLSAQMVDPTGQAVFQSLTSEIDEIIIPVGKCQLHLVFGDISNETTDAVVNTTDFSDFQTDVCNDILTVAGPEVQAALTGAHVNKGDILTTQPGNFPCKVIMHVCGEKDSDIIKGLARDIVSKCERDGYQSVAIPAICAGKGGLDARLIAQSILQGVKDATITANFRHLKSIRIVILKINVFLEFKAMAQQLFGTFTQMTAAAAPLRAASRGNQSLTLSRGLSSLSLSLPVQQRSTAEFLVIGQTAENVSGACQELRQAFERACSTQSYSAEEYRHLGQDEIDHITNNADSLGIEINQHIPDSLVVRGLTTGVNEVKQLMQGALLRQVRGREQDIVFAHVSWCILGFRGNWERLPKEAHHQLENNNIAGGVLDAQGRRWMVNLTRKEVTLVDTPGLVAKLKRLENLSDFSFPLYWDDMSGEAFKLVPLHPSSAEYSRVKTDFKKTVQKAVLKIERIQNVHLRRAYEVRKKELQDKNGGVVGAGEKVLYHGTKEDACVSIQKSNFDRRFAGQNATRYGLGTYFAVNANYSAQPTFSVPAADGTQLMFVALVLTGYYTQGQSNMRIPPSRSSQDLNDRYDSVVDNVQNPQMFVVFHDCQAYPDYLITFK